MNEANTRFALAQYVRLREGYAAPEAEYNFRAVSLMSAAAEQRRYADTVRAAIRTARRRSSAKAASSGSTWRACRCSGRPRPGAVHPRGAEGQRRAQGHRLDRDDRLRMEAGRADQQRGSHDQPAGLPGLRLSRGQRDPMTRSIIPGLIASVAFVAPTLAEQDPIPAPMIPACAMCRMTPSTS